ncbi:MAG: glycoside hydrolase family 1 protein [Acidimicrobiia bacterium]|nr:glycoside hydrolase family 1 protein [Acidimicrobiia bacterium]
MPTTLPDGFLWGTATAAHQVEGGNWNNDWWAFEHREGTPCAEPSADACDQYHLYRDDLALLAGLGFGAYRFSVEWSRIEPEEGEFSAAALDHYRRVLAACHEHGILPVVTYHHFTTPRWAAEDGGWANPAIVDRFARFCARTAAALGDLTGMACTINEPNVVSIMGYLIGMFPPGENDLGRYATVNANLIAAHAKAFGVIKAGPGDAPVGLCVAMGDWWVPEGSDEVLADVRHMHEGQFLEAARDGDFVGVQAYSRTRLDGQGMPLGPEEGIEVLDMGYEYWPQALEVSIRHAVEVSRLPVYVTENGIGTTDDDQRIRYVTDALGGLGRCLDDGLDVRGYFYWSLLDNFEWALGYMPRFGLVAVDRATQRRAVKPSATWLGELARTNRLPA